MDLICKMCQIDPNKRININDTVNNLIAQMKKLDETDSPTEGSDATEPGNAIAGTVSFQYEFSSEEEKVPDNEPTIIGTGKIRPLIPIVVPI